MSELIRVLHVVTHMNRGGLESMIMNYYRNIDRTKVQFDFLTHRSERERKDFNEEIISFGGCIYHVSHLNPFSRSYLKELDLFFKNHKEYKIIHVHQDCMSSVILKAAKKNNIPVRIAHCHNSSQDKGLKYFIKLLYKKSIKKFATRMFACGQKSGEWMFGTTDFEILPNAIDAKAYSYNPKTRNEVRKEFNLGEDYVIGHVARFSDVKNHVFLINVFEYIAKTNMNVKLLLVGAGEKREYIEQLVREKGLTESVIFAGLRKDIYRVMQAIDVFLLPSLFEGLPVTMIEAQAAGLPCIISEGVPLDCKITENVEQISLDISIDKWVGTVMKYKNFKRIDMYEEIVRKNFDIKNNAQYLQEFYLSML